jgi:hypothetical protein
MSHWPLSARNSIYMDEQAGVRGRKGGVFCIPFDLGVWRNALQFLRVGAHAVDWSDIYTLEDYRRAVAGARQKDE